MPHLIPAAIDHHMTAVTGASLLALMGVFNFMGTTLSGWLSDRLDNRHLLGAVFMLPATHVEHRLRGFDQVTATAFSGQEGLGAVVAEMLRALGIATTVRALGSC